MSADAGPAWAAWADVTPVIVAPAGRERYARASIPLRIAPSADGGYPDLRVIDERSTEIAYALDPRRAASAPYDAQVIDRGFVPNRWSQAVLDLGGGGRLVDTIRLTLDDAQRPTYLQRVAVDASDDRATWRVVRDGAIIYRVAQDAGRGNQTIAFPATRSRWLRVRILDLRTPFTVTGAEVDRTPGAAQPLKPVATARLVIADEAAHQHRQFATFDVPAAIRPSAVVFDDAESSFARHAVVESSDDGTQWSTAGESPIARFADGGKQTSFAFPEQTARYWRVTVENGDDAPIRGLRATLLQRDHQVVFAAAGGAAYRLLSRNPAAAAPAYDLGERLAHSAWSAAPASLGPTEKNLAYRDMRPITERFPWLLSVALGAVAAALGFVALRTVRTATAK